MQNEILGKIWEMLKPLLVWLWELCKIAWQWFLIILRKIIFVFSIAYNFALEMISTSKEKYEIAKPIIMDFAEKNRVAALAISLVVLLVLFFWIWAMRHAAKNEEVWKKIWIFVIFILGPLGALIYYFGRKRALEKKIYEKQRVALSFFTPMSKRPTEKK